MKWDEELDDLLNEAGRAHRAVEPPKKLEGALLARMQEQTVDARRARMAVFKRRGLTWGLAAALLMLAVWGGRAWRGRDTKSPKREEQVRREEPVRVEKPDVPVVPERVVEPLRKHAGQARKAIAANKELASVEAGGSLDVFVPLPMSEGLAPANQLSLVRVRMKGSDLQQYGLETSPDAAARNLLAEFVVGEDGLPRAIRIVQ